MTILILASSSLYRGRLLEKLGLPFQQVTPAVDESPETGETPVQLVERLAQLKAQEIGDGVEGEIDVSPRITQGVRNGVEFGCVFYVAR